ncbi:MAG: nitroreductase family protein, partial [Chloroflexi bacterium]|nr:nitroreductase family protein [Chloroflexota bacterium]
MNTIEAILSRRSIRRFTQEPLTEEQIETILKCACAAPSAMNGQPWYFLVITDRQKLNEISEHHPYSSMLKEAPMAILVMGKISQ